MLKDVRVDPEGYYLTANLVKPKGKIKSICMISYGDDIEVQLCDDVRDDEYDGGDVIKTMNFNISNISLEQAIYNLANEKAGELQYFIPKRDRADDINNPKMMKVVRRHYKSELSPGDNSRAMLKKRIKVDGRIFNYDTMLLIKACHAVRKELEAKGVKCAKGQLE